MAGGRLTVTEAENRGGPDAPFGYVYFSDGTRVGFTPGLDAEIWPSNHGDVTGVHMRLAALALVEAGWLHTGPAKFRINHPLVDVVTVEPARMC